MAVRWVSIPDQYNEAGEVVPTRLVIHQRGLKIDFAFYTMAMLPKVERNGGYSVLLDKDDMTAHLTRPTRGVRKSPPTE
jgi:hypothetical protein